MRKTDESSGNLKDDSQQINESPSVRLMKLLEKIEMDQWNPYDTNKYLVAAGFFLILSFIICYLQLDFGHVKGDNGYHKEILPSSQLCYIKDGELVPLADGAYPVAMPSQDSTLVIEGKKVFPMLLILVPTSDFFSSPPTHPNYLNYTDDDFELYPLNIADDSLLPRRGDILALHILFGFTNEHAENKLVYAEKIHDTAAEDYKRKAFYYLVVKDGYGKMERDYMTKDNAGDNFKYYRDVDHVKEELITIYQIENRK